MTKLGFWSARHPGSGTSPARAGSPRRWSLKRCSGIIVKEIGGEERTSEEARIAIPFKSGDRVRVKEGYFQNFEGEVESIDETNGRVTVIISIFGRSTPVELQHWQIESV
jgi:transcription termination/antitermination protein NusG